MVEESLRAVGMNDFIIEIVVSTGIYTGEVTKIRVFHHNLVPHTFQDYFAYTIVEPINLDGKVIEHEAVQIEGKNLHVDLDVRMAKIVVA